MGSWSNLKFCVFVLTCVVLVNAQKDSCRTPDGETATCTPIESCKPINDILDIVPQPFPKKIRQLLRSYLCPARNRQPRVCCPSSSIPIEPPDVSNHKNINLLPENCGILYTGDRIVGGNKTKLYEYPWMALLSYRTNNGPKFKCGGSIINERYILTAAHCITNLKYPLIGIRVGEHNIDTRQDCEITKEGEKICSPAVQDLAIEETIPHPSYNTTAQTHDIGLLRVKPMDLTRENIKPICLPLDRARNYNFTGRNAVVTGWGFTETGRSSPILLQVRLPTIPHEECQTIYKNIAKINYRQVCAGGKLGFDSCGGDSGGPLQTISNLHGDSRIVQQGIVSFGPKLCGGTGLPGVYTKITHYMDWILDNMKA